MIFLICFISRIIISFECVDEVVICSRKVFGSFFASATVA